jgi:hypothetical protein
VHGELRWSDATGTAGWLDGDHCVGSAAQLGDLGTLTGCGAQ